MGGATCVNVPVEFNSEVIIVSTPTISILASDSVFVSGEWAKPSGTAKLSVISPVTEEVVQTFPEAQPQDVDRAVAGAREAFDKGPWPRMSRRSAATTLLKVAES